MSQAIQTHTHAQKNTLTHTLSVSPGCLWARKGSHREPLRSQLVRTEGAADPANTSGLRAKIAPKEINVDGADAAGLSSAKARGWLGKVPGHESLGADSVTYSPATEAALREAGFVPLPVKAGDLVSFLCPHALVAPAPPPFSPSRQCLHGTALMLLTCSPTQVCFPGTTDHLSLANRTPHARHTYQLHLVEGPGAGVEWSKENWMQYPSDLAFPSLSL